MKKRYLEIAYFFVFIILLSCNIFATDWYVQPATGEYGAENGTSWATAFDGFSDIAWGSISAGDNIYLSDGTYAEALTVGASGSWNNYINILAGKYSPSPTGHDGEVIINLNGGGSQGIEITSRSWVYIKGLTVKNTGSNGILIYLTARHIVIDSCDVSNAGGFGIYGNGAACQGPGQDMDAWDSTDVIMDITIKNCYIHSFADEWPNTDDMVQITCGRDIKIHDNLIFNNNLQSERTGEHIHQDDIQTFNVQGLKIYNNILVIDSAAMGHNMIIDCQSRDGDEYSGVDECIVYNNLVYHGGHLESGGDPNTQHLYLRWYDENADMAPTYILHNTFVWANGSGADIEMQRKGTFKNNIFYHDGTWGQNPSVYGGAHVGFWSSGGDYHADFTTQVDSQIGNLFWFRWTTNNDVDFGNYLPNWVGSGGSPNTGSPTNWAGWSGASWGGSGVHQNPLFADTLWDDRTSNSFEILTNSPAINAGVQDDFIEYFLTSRGLPTTDFHGNQRDSQWDIGAIEFGASGVTDTVPSFSFTPVTNAALNTQYEGTATFTNVDTTFTVSTTTSASFKINSGVANTLSKTAVSGDVVTVYNQAGGVNATTYTETIVAGGNSQNFNVTTVALPDTVPNSFDLIDYNFVNTSTSYTSFPFQLSGFDSCNAYFGGQDFAIKRSGTWGSPSSTMRKVYSTDSLRLSLTSSGSQGVGVNADFVAGGTTDNWRVTTKTAGSLSKLGILSATGKTSEVNHPSSKAIDGLEYGDDEDSRWSAEPMPLSIVFDLGSIKTIIKHETSFAYYFDGQYYNYSVDISKDNTNWYNVVAEKLSSETEWTSDSLSIGYEARYMRINHISNELDNEWAGEYETYMFGLPSSTPRDTIPNFSFTSLNNAEINTQYSATATFSGADSTFTVSTTTNAIFKIGNGVADALTKTAVNDDIITVYNTTGGSYSTTYTETIIAGGVSRDFTVTTKAETYVPPPSGNGGWGKQPDGRGIITKDGKLLITR